MVQKWTKTLTFSDFTATFDAKVTDTATWLVAKYKVPAQQVVRVGTGQIQNGVDDRGVFFLSVKDNATTPVQVNGQYRITYLDANELNKKVIKEGSTANVRTSKTVRDASNVLPETGPGVRQDSYVVIEFLPAVGSKTIKIAASELQLPVTVYTA
jgi:hypothetical protein